jgi:hypothetical protein
MVAAIFSVIAGFDTPSLQKLYAIARAGEIAKAYLGTNHNDTTTAVRDSAFPSKQQPLPENSVLPYPPSEYVLLPAEGRLPETVLSMTPGEGPGTGVGLDHPVYTILRRHIRGERDGLPALSTILCEVFLSTLRVQRVLLARVPSLGRIDDIIGRRIRNAVIRALGRPSLFPTL